MDHVLLDTFKGLLSTYPYNYIRYLLEWNVIKKHILMEPPNIMEMKIDKIVKELIDKCSLNNLIKNLDQAYINMGMAICSEDLDRYYKSLGGIRVH